MTGSFDRKLLGNGADCAIFQLALSDTQEVMWFYSICSLPSHDIH